MFYGDAQLIDHLFPGAARNEGGHTNHRAAGPADEMGMGRLEGVGPFIVVNSPIGFELPDHPFPGIGRENPVDRDLVDFLRASEALKNIIRRQGTIGGVQDMEDGQVLCRLAKARLSEDAFRFGLWGLFLLWNSSIIVATRLQIKSICLTSAGMKATWSTIRSRSRRCGG